MNKPTVNRIVADISAELKRHADSRRAEGAMRYFKGDESIAFLGVDTPTLRRIVKDQVKELKHKWTLGEAVQACGKMLKAKEHEIRAAGFLLLSGFKKMFTPALLYDAYQWLNSRLDNWALVDGFCMEITTPLLDQYPEAEETLKEWSQNSNLWVRRAALVTLVAGARRGKRLDLTYRTAGEHFNDPEDLIHKAVGWLLREAGKSDSRRLRNFLLKHGPQIPRTTLRYAIERFPEKERKHLLASTRKPKLKGGCA